MSRWFVTLVVAFAVGFPSTTSKQPYVKVTTQLGSHELSGFYQNDKNRFTSSRERYTDLTEIRSAGGSMLLGKLNSVWGQHVTTSFSASYNNKGGNDEEAYSDTTGFGPRVLVHQIAPISSGRPTGNGILVEMNNVEIQRAQHGRSHAVEHRGAAGRDGALQVTLQPPFATCLPDHGGLQVLGRRLTRHFELATENWELSRVKRERWGE